jgi:hypothetical protein
LMIMKALTSMTTRAEIGWDEMVVGCCEMPWTAFSLFAFVVVVDVWWCVCSLSITFRYIHISMTFYILFSIVIGHTTTCCDTTCGSGRCRRWWWSSSRSRYQHFAILYRWQSRFTSRSHDCLGGIAKFCGCGGIVAHLGQVSNGLTS